VDDNIWIGDLEEARLLIEDVSKRPAFSVLHDLALWTKYLVNKVRRELNVVGDKDKMWTFLVRIKEELKRLI